MSGTPANVFLCWGQSNMQGCGAVDTLPPLQDERVFNFRDGAWETAREPLTNWGCTLYPNGGAGLGFPFAIDLLNTYPNTTIGLVNSAVGGTPLDRWMPGGDLFDNAVTQAQAALESGATLAGILWHQGEAESSEQERADTYLARFSRTIHGARDIFGNPNLPVIAGELGWFLENNGVPFFKTVNAELHEAAAMIPGVACVSSEGFTDTDRNDNCHFDTQSLRIFGQRYADAYRQFIHTGNALPLE